MARDETKRRQSPPSFFFARSWGIVLATNYFNDERLRGSRAVAAKHRHRIQYAAFGQLMASFEWCLKDFVAQLVDATDLFDDKVDDAKWIQVEKSGVLASREVFTSAGAVLIHPTQGWHDPNSVNARYVHLFGRALLDKKQSTTLERLWLLRHSVAHNAGYVTNHDAYRMQAPSLSNKAVRIDGEFLNQTWEFLGTVVRNLQRPIGERIVIEWCSRKATGDFSNDEAVYRRLKHVTSAVESRSKSLPHIDERKYHADRAIAAAKP
ncbi:MAG TPA: hypothetical protein VIJ39_06380 [Solirubrobacteraceae bacterium]